MQKCIPPPRGIRPPSEVGPQPNFHGPDMPSCPPPNFLRISVIPEVGPSSPFHSPNVPSWPPRTLPMAQTSHLCWSQVPRKEGHCLSLVRCVQWVDSQGQRFVSQCPTEFDLCSSSKGCVCCSLQNPVIYKCPAIVVQTLTFLLKA